jgi:hypothetical protein
MLTYRSRNVVVEPAGIHERNNHIAIVPFHQVQWSVRQVTVAPRRKCVDRTRPTTPDYHSAKTYVETRTSTTTQTARGYQKHDFARRPQYGALGH